MTSSNTLPVLVGVGQWTNREREPGRSPEPLDYMARCARLAAEDAGAPQALRRIDNLSFIAVMSRAYRREPGRLAEMLGARPADIVTTVYGAVVPQTLLARLCGRIAAGKSEAGLIVGAEAFHTAGKPDWGRLTRPDYDATLYPLHGETRDASSPLERLYGLDYPAVVYPLFANAYRKARGLSPAAYLAELGRFCASFAAVAAGDPYAWSRDGKSARELSTVTPDNRMIHYPFTKYMNANMNVDQAAALLVMSEAKADALGIPPSKRVYLLGCGEATEPWHFSTRADFHSAPALAVAAREAFAQAGIGRDRIGWVDYYSCFPVAAQIAKDTLGLPPQLPPTVTGGLPFFGGAGTHYTLHALCAMVRLLRASPEKKGLVHSLSWFLSKHAVGILGGERPPGFRRRDPREYRHEAEALNPVREVLKEANGEFTVETYTVSHGRSGEPERAVVLASNGRGGRAFALNEEDPHLMRSMTVDEPIGKSVRISHDGASGLNRFRDLR